MIWQRLKYYQQSSTGHRIAACRVRGKWRFALCEPKRGKYKPMGVFDTAEEARKICEEKEA